MLRHALFSVPMSIAVLAAGCGAAEGPAVLGDGGAPSPAQATETVDCGGSVYDPSTLDDAPSAATLPEGPAGAVDDAGQAALTDPETWRVVFQSENRVDLVRELDEPLDAGGGDLRTHESRTLELITGSSNVADGTWLLTSAGPCTQRRAGGVELGEANLTLARAPSPDDTTVDLLVFERACASGQSAEGRVELVELEETAERVGLHIAVRPLDGAQTCQGNPPTPFTIELSDPVGERDIVDISVVPAQAVTVAQDNG